MFGSRLYASGPLTSWGIVLSKLEQIRAELERAKAARLLIQERFLEDQLDR
jgi:hypothetical protein